MLPRVGLNNLFGQGTLSASSEDPDFPVENIADGVTYDYYRPAVGSPVSSEEWVAVELDAPASADYFAIAAHTLADVGATVVAQYFEAGVSPDGWVDASAPYTPTDNGPFRVMFPSWSSTGWRLLITGYDDDFSIGVANIGMSVQMQRGFPLSWKPPLRSNEKTEFTNNIAVGGQILGRNIVRQNITVEISQAKATRAWVDAVWEPLIEELRLSPFFMWWSPDHAEVIYGAMASDAVTSYSSADLLDVSFEMEGLVR